MIPIPESLARGCAASTLDMPLDMKLRVASHLLTNTIETIPTCDGPVRFKRALPAETQFHLMMICADREHADEVKSFMRPGICVEPGD
ncbi:hypothetical protein HDU87_002068, partial [Geranomyces variabilis]